MRRNSPLRNLTFSAMCAALSFVLLYGGTMTGLLDMSSAILSGLITTVLAAECSRRHAVTASLVTFVLTFVLLHDKTVSILYITAGGVYPIIKPYLDRVRTKALSWTLKVLSAVIIVSAYITSVFLFIPAEAAPYLIPAGLTLGVFCILLYDVLLSRFIIIYKLRLSKFIRRR